MMGMMHGQMPMGQQQAHGHQGHPPHGMQLVMMPGQGGAQMQHAMQQGMPGQMQGQMPPQMQGVQGQMAQQMPGAQGHMGPDGHPMAQGPCGQMAPDGKGGGPCQAGPTDGGDGKGGGARVAAGLGRNTQPKQGANWQQGAGRGAGRSSDARPFEPSHQEQAPAVPGEQGKGASGNQAGGQTGQQDGQKGNKLRNPKNPWADIQDSAGDQDLHQLWDLSRPQAETNQKAGFTGQTKGGKGKKDGGKDGGKNNDDMGGGKGGKDPPQQKWVEKTDPSQGKGQNRGHVRDQWQPKDMMKQQAQAMSFAQQSVPMSPGGKSNSKGGGYQQLAMGGPMTAQSPGPKKKKGSGDPQMDDWLNARFQGQPPPTPTGSTAMDQEMWGEEDDGERRKRKGGGKGGGGKGQNGKSKGGNGGKGKAKGGKGGGGSWQQRTQA